MAADHNVKLEEMRLAMLDAARAQNHAGLLDEKRKIVRSQLVKKYRADGKGIGEAEHLAIASEQYETAVNEAFLADLDAGLKKADAEFRRIEWDTWRTKAANKRAELAA
jgi:hypothetical protein